MSSLRSHEPDNLYCVYCHAPAAGACATCKAIVCSDCAKLKRGAVKIIAICKSCDRKGRGDMSLRAWRSILVPIAGLLLVMMTLVFFLSQCKP